MPVNSQYDDVDDYRNYMASPPSVKLRQSELASLNRNFTQLYMTPKDVSRNYRAPSPRRASTNYTNIYNGGSRSRRTNSESDDEMDGREEDFSPILDPAEMAELDPSTILRNYPPELSRVFGSERGGGDDGLHRDAYKGTRGASREPSSIKATVDDRDWRRDRWNEKDPASVVDNLQSSSVIEKVRQSQRTHSPTNRRLLMGEGDKENVDSFQRSRLLGTSPELRKESPSRSGSKDDPFRNPFTPPKSSPDYIKKTVNVADVNIRDIDDLKHHYEEQIEAVKKSERERANALERDYRGQLSRVQKDLDQLLRQQQHLESVKTDMTRVLEEEIQDLRARLEDEQEMHRREEDDLKSLIAKLKAQVEELRQRKSVFDEDDDVYDGEKRRLIKDCEQKMASMKREHDLKITQLINQFEQEKRSAMDIMRTRIKTELSLIIPKLKQQFRDTYTHSITKARVAAEAAAQQKYEQALRSVKEEHAREREQSLRDLKARYELERREWQEKLKEKYELRLMQARNECERRILSRLKGV